MAFELHYRPTAMFTAFFRTWVEAAFWVIRGTMMVVCFMLLVATPSRRQRHGLPPEETPREYWKARRGRFLAARRVAERLAALKARRWRRVAYRAVPGLEAGTDRKEAA